LTGISFVSFSDGSVLNLSTGLLQDLPQGLDPTR